MQILHLFMVLSRPGGGARPHLLHLTDGNSTSNSEVVGDMLVGVVEVGLPKRREAGGWREYASKVSHIYTCDQAVYGFMIPRT